MATVAKLPGALRSLFAEMRRFAPGPHTWGMRVERSRIVLGMQNDLATGEEPLLHELAHAIEIDLPRLGLPDWGLRGSSALNAFADGQSRPTSADVYREMRVLAIQANLHEFFGSPFFVKTSALPLRHLTGWGTFVTESGGDGRFGGQGWGVEDTMLPRLVSEFQGDPRFLADRSIAAVLERDRILDAEPDRLRPSAKRKSR